MKRRSCVFGSVAISLCLGGGPIAAEESAPAPEIVEEESAPVPEVAAPVAAAEDTGAGNAGSRGFHIVGELLIVQPTLDDSYFVLTAPSSNVPSGQRKNNEYDGEPAFRFGVGYAVGDTGRELELGYTWIDAEASETVGGTNLSAALGSPDFASSFEDYAGVASADSEFSFQRIDAQVIQSWDLSDAEFNLRFGVEWVDFRVSEEYVFVNAVTAGLVHGASRSWGIGPDVGIGLRYDICQACGIPGVFSLNLGSSVGLVLGETHSRTTELITGVAPNAVRDDETSRVIPSLHARGGFSYAVPVAERVGLSVNVGYQIDSYLDGARRIAFVDDVADGLASTDSYDVSVQGLYASLGVVF